MKSQVVRAMAAVAIASSTVRHDLGMYEQVSARRLHPTAGSLLHQPRDIRRHTRKDATRARKQQPDLFAGASA